MLSRMQWLLRSDYDVEQESGKDKNLSVTPVMKTTERHAAPEAGQELKLFLSYFFVKKYLLVGASGMLWTGQWVSE